jgi:hypothetical protein
MKIVFNVLTMVKIILKIKCLKIFELWNVNYITIAILFAIVVNALNSLVFVCGYVCSSWYCASDENWWSSRIRLCWLPRLCKTAVFRDCMAWAHLIYFSSIYYDALAQGINIKYIKILLCVLILWCWLLGRRTALSKFYCDISEHYLQLEQILRKQTINGSMGSCYMANQCCLIGLSIVTSPAESMDSPNSRHLTYESMRISHIWEVSSMQNRVENALIKELILDSFAWYKLQLRIVDVKEIFLRLFWQLVYTWVKRWIRKRQWMWR